MSELESPFKPTVLAGRVALVTGGGSGIGFDIARELGQHGAKVVLMGRRQNFLDEAVEILQSHGIKASSFSGDVRKYSDCEGAVQKAVSEFGSLDTLVNSAAGNFLAPAEGLSSNGFRTVMEIDALGVFNSSRAAFEALKESKRGSIINISATLHYGATWYQAHASAAKAAIDSLTRTLAMEWGLYGIRVNGIAPGPIADTPGMTKLAPKMTAKQMDKLLGKRIPIQRIGRKFDISMSAVFLCSNGADFLTGDTLVVDGGSWLATMPPPFPRDQVAKLARGVEKQSRSMGATAKSKL